MSKSILFSLAIFITSLSSAFASFQLAADRLREPEVLKLIQGRVGVLSHGASRNHEGVLTVDSLVKLPGVDLKMIFSPEHGFRGIEDDRVTDSTDPVTGIPVYSLYGPRRAPTAEMLSKLDIVVVELQDVGLRYYTYPATVVYLLQACKKAGVRVVLLDRPNPLGGTVVEGAILEDNLANGGLTTIAPIPTRHGMTLGELALYLNDQLKIGAKLEVVTMKDYQRNTRWSETGLQWLPPSPALVNLEQVQYYAAFGAMEAMNLAVGRGMSNVDAFKVYGAPWISDGTQSRILNRLNALGVKEAKFTPYRWKVDRAEYSGSIANGVRIALNTDELAPVFELGLKVFKALAQETAQSLGIDQALSMLGARWVMNAAQGVSAYDDAIKQNDADSKEFENARAKYLKYSLSE